jgi:hypothetical protein
MPAAIRKKSAVATTPKSPAKKGAAKVSKKTASVDESKVKSLVKELVKEIGKHGSAIQASVASKKTFTASSKIAKQNQIVKAVQARVVKRAVLAAVTPAARNIKSAVNAEILHRSVGKSIKTMGYKPISLIATSSVKKVLCLIIGP